jgi:O-antigen/teichoic acid export membrane protein
MARPATGAATTATRDAAAPPADDRVSGWRRIVGISASLVGSQALTSVLGLGFWTLAARAFPTTEVGVAAAAVSMMTLLSSLGSLGLGTLLISRLPRTAAGQRRVLVRTCLLAAGLGGAALALLVPMVAIHGFGADNLRPVAGTAAALLGLVVGTGLASLVLVLDQAVLTIGVGGLQLERNTAASVIKIVALVGLAVAGVQDGMGIFLAWTIGTLGSLPLVLWRTRRGTRPGDGLPVERRLVRFELLRGLGRSALSHHALNTTLQGAMQILPIIVTLVLTVEQNAVFNTALMVCGLVFALPYAIAFGVFAAARGDEDGVVSRLPMTVGASTAVGVVAYAVLYPLAGYVLALFGPEYVDGGTPLLRLLAMAGPAFVIKDHYVALRRVQDRTTTALRLLAAFLVVELVAAALGAALGGAAGLCAAWVAVLYGEALVLAVPLWQAWRRHRPGATPAVVAADPTSLVPVVRPAPRPAPAAPTRTLFGPILLVMAVGVAVMGAGAALARGGDVSTAAQLAWVLGQVLIVAPATYRIVGAATGAGERVGLAVAAGVLLQLSRTVLYPVRFSFHDEQLHLTTFRQLHDSGQLFGLNPLLPVSGYYPGLELVTDAVVRLAGLPVFAAATLVLLAARVVIMLALIGLIRVLTRSGRAAAIAAVVYLCNPQLLFFNSQFSYQTLALPLAVFTAYAFVVRRRDTRGALVLPLLGLLGVVVTHHLTAMLLVGALAMWLLGEWLFGGRGEAGADRRRWRRLEVRHLAVLTAVGAGAVLAGVLLPGNPAGGYLGEIFTASGSGVADLAATGDLKPTFAEGNGPALWERLLLDGSVLVSGLALLAAVVRLRVGARTGDVAGIVIALLALLYPIVPASHLTTATAEAGDRAAGFVYIGLGAVIGWWLCRRGLRRWQLVTVTALLVVGFLGGVVLGAGPTARQLPGPYLVEADARSMDADNLAAARWLAGFVPPDSRVFADRTGGLLASADGRQFTVRHLSTRIDASRLLLDPAFTDQDVDRIREAQIDYLIVDLRISSALPTLGVYVETGEYEGRGRTEPVPAAALAKFAAVPGVDRIYDSGTVQVYDVRRLRDGG